MPALQRAHVSSDHSTRADRHRCSGWGRAGPLLPLIPVPLQILELWYLLWYFHGMFSMLHACSACVCRPSKASFVLHAVPDARRDWAGLSPAYCCGHIWEITLCALFSFYALLCPCTADRVHLQCWQPSSIVLQRHVLTCAMLDCADDQQQIVTASLDKSVALWSATVRLANLACPTPSALTGESHRACAALPRPLHTDDVVRHCPACVVARWYAGISMKQLESAAQVYFCNYLWQIFFCQQLYDIDCVCTTYSVHIEAPEITSAHASAR